MCRINIRKIDDVYIAICIVAGGLGTEVERQGNVRLHITVVENLFGVFSFCRIRRSWIKQGKTAEPHVFL